MEGKLASCFKVKTTPAKEKKEKSKSRDKQQVMDEKSPDIRVAFQQKQPEKVVVEKPQAKVQKNKKEGSLSDLIRQAYAEEPNIG